MTRQNTSIKPQVQASNSLLDNLNHLTGPLPFRPTNDYLFRAILQENESALRGLLSALLDISKEDIISVTILNPIILGESINEKTIILDLKILLNNNRILNLEMQVANKGDWPERSLYYLCQNFARIPKGGSYKDILPTMHIGILDFSPFPDNQQFYSEYLLCNTKNHKIYSDKFAIRMLNLNQIENATNEEKNSDLYQWASLFKASTWEEIKMLADDNSSISEFVFTLHEMTEDEKIREQCLARDLYEHDKISAIAYGKRQGHEQLNELIKLLLEANRLDDLRRSTTDPDYQAQLLKEFNL